MESDEFENSDILDADALENSDLDAVDALGNSDFAASLDDSDFATSQGVSEAADASAFELSNDQQTDSLLDESEGVVLDLYPH